MPSAGATARVRMPCRSSSWAASACARSVGSGSRAGSSDHRPPLAAPVQPEGGRPRGRGRRPAGPRRAARAADAAGRPRGAAARVLCAVLPLPSQARSGASPSLVTWPVHTRSQTASATAAWLGEASSGRSWRTRSASAPRNQAPPRAEGLEDRGVQRARRAAARAGGRVRSATARGVQRDEPVVPGERPVARPDDLARGGQLVEHRRGVVGHARGQHVGLERRRRQHGARELLDHAGDPVDAAQRPRRGARARTRPTGWTPCQRGRNTPSACGATGSTSARSAASERRRSVRSTSASQNSSPVPPSTSGRSRPWTSTPSRSSRRRVSVTTATPQPNRAAACAAVNGPCVRACRRSRSPTGSGTTSVNTSGTPTGQGDPERVAQPPGVLDGGPLLRTLRGHAAEPHADQPPGALELGQPRRHLVADLGLGALGRARRR